MSGKRSLETHVATPSENINQIVEGVGILSFNDDEHTPVGTPPPQANGPSTSPFSPECVQRMTFKDVQPSINRFVTSSFERFAEAKKDNVILSIVKMITEEAKKHNIELETRELRSVGCYLKNLTAVGDKKSYQTRQLHFKAVRPQLIEPLRNEYENKMIDLLQWNINGYSNNYESLEVLIKNCKPHVIAIQETKLNEQPVNINQLYEMKRMDHEGGIRGLAFLIRKDLLPSTTSELDALKLKENKLNEQINTFARSDEVDVFAVYVELPEIGEVIFCNMYVPANLKKRISLSEFVKMLRATFKEKKFILVGDFNDHAQDVLEFPEIKTNDFISLNRNGQDTCREMNKRASIIDLTICTKQLENLWQWDVCETNDTDHLPIILVRRS